MTPHAIRALLSSRAFMVVARIALTCAFWWGGLAKLVDFQGAVAEARHFGLAPADLVASLTIAVELLGSALLILGRWTWLAAGALGVFTLLATVIAHGFWAVSDPAEHFREFNTFLEHIGLVGGLAIAAALDTRHEGEQR